MTLLPWDLVLGLAGVILTLSLLPTAIKKGSRVPAIGSLPLAIGLTIYTIGFIDLGLFFSAGTTGVQVVLWTWILFRRRLKSEPVSENKNSKSKKSDIELPMTMECNHEQGCDCHGCSRCCISGIDY